MKRHMLAATTVVALLFLLTLGASRASADTLTFQITSDHCTGTCGTAPFGTVVLTTAGANVNFNVTLINGNTFAQTGAADGQIFKFNGTGVAVGDITVGAHVPALAAATGAFNGDGTGPFTFGINCPSCGNGPTGFGGSFTFTVANATFADLTVGNPTNIFVADILGSNGNTGPVDVSTPGVVPDGGMTLMLLGGALVGLETLRRKFRA